MSRSRHLVLPAVLIALAASLGASPVTQKTEQKAKTGPAQPAKTEMSPDGQVIAEGTLSTRDSAVGDTLRFWINVRNRTPETVCTLTVTVPEIEGYRDIAFQPSPPENAKTLGCPDPTTSRNALSIAGLKPGQSRTIRGTLKADEAHDLQNIEAVLSWMSPNGAASETVVSLGDNQVKSWPFLEWLVGGIYEGVKDLAVPFMLAAMTYYFGRWDKEREQDRKLAEDKRQEDQKEAERLRTWQAETWKQMLPKSHALAEEHYVPIAGSLDECFDTIRRCLKETDDAKREEKEREAFYEFMLLGVRIRKLNQAIFFKDRVGEMLAATCFSDYLEEFYGSSSEKGRGWYGQTVDRLPAETRAKKGFMRRFAAPPATGMNNPVWECWQFFRERYVTPEGQGAIFLLAGFHAVLTYEMNRPYEHWYKIPEKLVLPKDAGLGFSVEEVLNDVAKRIQEDEGEGSDFISQARDYIKRGRGEGKHQH